MRTFKCRKAGALSLLFRPLLFTAVLATSPLTLHAQGAANVTIRVATPQAPPDWALLQREILRASALAAEQFANRYFDERGYILSDLRWGMNDGPDDAIENINRWPEMYALGAPRPFMDLSKKIYNGHVRQYTEARTTYVPFAKDGMFYKEFPVHSDWMHHSEGIQMFNNMGLMDPDDPIYEHRVRRFAGFYMNEDPGALNYDPVHKLIRSTWNGSRGPVMRLTTAVDWVGDPTEMVNRYGALHGEANYEEMLFHYKDYHDTVGDHPLNLLVTNLAMNAYALTGERKYRDWLIEYVDAWYDRMQANNWVIPSNIGLDGTIGGGCGKWYCGAYGWSFTIDAQTPPSNRLENRQRTRWGFPGFMNAYVLTGDDRYLQAWRNQDDVLVRAGQLRNGVLYTPEMYGNPMWSHEGFTDNDGWYSFRPREQDNLLELYYLSWRPEDRRRITSNAWLDYLEGNNPSYPVEALRGSLADIQRRARMAIEDTTTPDTRLVDDPMAINPIQAGTLTSLNRLMVGGIYMYARGILAYTRLRYFDVDRGRPGVPADVAALVERMTADNVTVTLINVNPTESRTMVVQGGGLAEHQIVAVTLDGARTAVNGSAFTVVLQPGSGATLQIEQRRFASQPTLSFPWQRAN
jgi:hypothetical protein